MVAESLRAEALALFQVNQAGRNAVERAGALLVTAIGLLVAAGVAAKTDDVAIVFSPIALTLLSYTLQQYAEVSVTGAARASLEERLWKQFRDDGLIYERLVAPIRQTPPLVVSVRVLQGVTVAILLAAVGYASYVAFDAQPWYIEIAYAVTTVATATSAGLSYLAMGRAGAVAAARVGAGLVRTGDLPGQTAEPDA